jgi:hypothetical protein
MALAYPEVDASNNRLAAGGQSATLPKGYAGDELARNERFVDSVVGSHALLVGR